MILLTTLSVIFTLYRNKDGDMCLLQSIIRILFSIFLFFFAAAALAKPMNFRKTEDPLSITVRIKPTIKNFDRPNKTLKENYNKNFQSFSFAGNSVFSQYHINKNNNAINVFDKVPEDGPISLTWLPLYDYSEKITFPSFSNRKDDTIWLTLFLLKFDLF